MKPATDEDVKTTATSPDPKRLSLSVRAMSQQRPKTSEGERPAAVEDALSPDSKKLIEQAEDLSDPDLRKRFVDAKIAKKRAEADRKMLQNRVLLLKAAEQKAQKKVDEMKKKAKELLDKRTRLAEEQKAKDEFRRAKKLEEERLAVQNTRFKLQLKEAIAEKQKSVLTTKQRKRDLLLLERSHAEQLLKSAKEEHASKKMARRQTIKSNEVALKKRREDEFREKQLKAKAEVETRIECENEERLRIEMEMNRLQQEEQELVLKFQEATLKKHTGNDEEEDQ